MVLVCTKSIACTNDIQVLKIGVISKFLKFSASLHESCNFAIVLRSSCSLRRFSKLMRRPPSILSKEQIEKEQRRKIAATDCLRNLIFRNIL